eukprot:13956516-Alexandrium_andersonii.AAC.1
MLVKSVQLGLSRCTGRLPMAEIPRREASPPPLRPFRALSGPTPDGRRTMGEDAFAWQLGAPRRARKGLS